MTPICARGTLGSARRNLTRRLLLTGLLGLAAIAGCAEDEPLHEGRTLTAWTEMLRTNNDLPAYNAAIDKLVVIGQPAVPVLIKRLDDADSHILRGCSLALLRIDPAVGLPLVCERLHQEHRGRGITMADSLIRANLEVALATGVMIDNLTNPDYYIYNESIKVLGELGPQSTAAVPVLAERLTSSTETDVRCRIARTLWRIGPGAAPAVPALCTALTDADAKVRESAAHALTAIGPAAKEAEGALRVALQDSDPKVRFRAGKALEKL